MRKEKARYLGHEAFSNRVYAIRIDFYDHGMADAMVDLKPGMMARRLRRQPSCFVPFDECVTESMADYADCLRMLDLDKVARRWFIRRMCHCTEGLLRPDGRPDMAAAERRQDWLFHLTRLAPTPLDGRQAETLLGLCPEAGFDGAHPDVCIQESFTALKREVRSRFFSGRKCIAMPAEMMLGLLERLFPVYSDTVRRERDTANCDVSLRISWAGNALPTMSACVQDHDFILYSKRA